MTKKPALREERIRIYYPKTAAGKKQWNREYGLNAYWAGKHWTKRKKGAEYWHRLVRSEMERQKVRRMPFTNAVIITFYWNSRLDIGNNAAMAKMIEDALKGVIIEDDSRKYVKGIEHYFHGEDFIRVVVREVDTIG